MNCKFCHNQCNLKENYTSFSVYECVHHESVVTYHFDHKDQNTTLYYINTIINNCKYLWTAYEPTSYRRCNSNYLKQFKNYEDDNFSNSNDGTYMNANNFKNVTPDNFKIKIQTMLLFL